MPRKFSEFSFEIHLKFKEVTMDKVVPFFKSFRTIFYMKFFEFEKVSFRPFQIQVS
jgi:hypothetical protein